MFKRLIIIAILLLKLLPMQQKADGVFAQTGEEDNWFDSCTPCDNYEPFDWSEIDNFISDWEDLQWQEQMDWLNEMNTYNYDQLNEMNNFWDNEYNSGYSNGADYDAWVAWWEWLNDNYDPTNPPSTDPPPPANDHRYYIKTNINSTKYYDGDKIFVPQQSGNVTLTLFKNNGSPLEPALQWYRNDTTKCSAIKNCNFIRSIKNSTLIKIDSTGGTTLIKCPLIIHEKLIVNFKRGGSYNGEYGWDDETYNHADIMATPIFATEIADIAGKYNVP
jgi:hypothetical protein